MYHTKAETLSGSAFFVPFNGWNRNGISVNNRLDYGTGGFDMSQQAKRSRLGWTEEERRQLTHAVQLTQEQGQPLRMAFESVAESTGRKPNSVRKMCIRDRR